jgi:hypothetical protein
MERFCSFPYKTNLNYGLAGSADSDVEYAIASQGEMADAMGFSGR